MKLSEIYDRPIGRKINPAVVVSDKKLETIQAEITEYVFTNELIKHLYDVLNCLVNKKDEKTGHLDQRVLRLG